MFCPTNLSVVEEVSCFFRNYFRENCSMAILLDKDTLNCVLLQLEPIDLISCACVCKDWNAAVLHDSAVRWKPRCKPTPVLKNFPNNPLLEYLQIQREKNKYGKGKGFCQKKTTVFLSEPTYFR
jgi:hypothetical protein